jgi:exodeoxyribonuclease VII large subunit
MTVPQKSFSVSELTSKIKNLLEPEFSAVSVKGEISNFKHHTSGHMYFTLKDKTAELRCVMFRGMNRNIQFKPEDGMDVLLQGKVTVYEMRGQYQLIVETMEPAGIGTLFLAFEALKKQLQSEGLFELSIKKPLPKYPRKIGIVTSQSGAAISDMVNIFQRRAPYIELMLRPAVVQGEEAARDIVNGIKQLDRIKSIDIIIIGRGGGSIEDLWPFNDELLARAISRCKTPIISAVGHETDVTISDMVSDVRAPTPSAAAEISAPSFSELNKIISNNLDQLYNLIDLQLKRQWQSLDRLSDRHEFQRPNTIIERHREVEKKLGHRLSLSLKHIISIKKTNIEGLVKEINALNPVYVLERGYSIAFKREGQIVRKEDDLKVGESFVLKTGKGKMEAEKKQSLPV